MSTPSKRTRVSKRLPEGQPQKPVIGMEAEFTLFVQDQKRKPEHVFQDPQAIVREAMIPRTGRSYHLPSGGAIYFDTGVIEVATPIIEMERGSGVRAARTLWDQIEYLRNELDAWEKRHDKRVRLEGFSTHYNLSVPAERGLDEAATRRLALLLTYIIHVPTMILAANRLSTGIGVRPRGTRLEVTCDFTPDPELMTATSALVLGICLGVMQWPDFGLSQLKERKIPVIAGFRPRKHTSRKGWLARFDCFPRSPFTADLNEPDWLLRDGRKLSLREIALEISAPFKPLIRNFADRAAFEHIFEVFEGNARSLLDFKERPPRYEDVGRVIDWNRRSMRTLPRSRYEKVIHHIITGRKLRVGSATYIPVRMQGWYEVVFRNAQTGFKRVFNLDDLVKHCAG